MVRYATEELSACPDVTSGTGIADISLTAHARRRQLYERSFHQQRGARRGAGAGMVRVSLAAALLVFMGMSGFAQQADRITVYTAEQAARGKIAERDNSLASGKGFGACSDCHAEGLMGRIGNSDERPALASLKPGVQREIAKAGGVIPELVGPTFRARWANRSVKDLIVNFTDRFAPRLSDQTRLDILAYVLSENGFRAGRQPLTMATDVPIRLLAE